MASPNPDVNQNPSRPPSPPLPFPQLPTPSSQPQLQELPSDFHTLIEVPVARQRENNKSSDRSLPAKQQQRHRRHEKDALPKNPTNKNNNIRQTHDREFAIGLVYHEAISKGATIQQARRAVEIELLTHARAKQLEAVRAMPHYHQRRWDRPVDQTSLVASSQPGSRSASRRPYDSNNKHNRRKRSKLRRLGRASRSHSSWSETSSWEDELPPSRPVSLPLPPSRPASLPLPLPFKPQWEPSRGRPITRTPSGSPARDREPNRRHLHMTPPHPTVQLPLRQSGAPHASSNSEPMMNAGKDPRRGGPSSSHQQRQQQQQHARSATTNTTTATAYNTYDAAKPQHQTKNKSKYTMTPALSPKTSRHFHRILHVVGSGSSAHANRCMRVVSPRASQFDDDEESVKSRCSWWPGWRRRSSRGRVGRRVCGSLRGMRRGSRRFWERVRWATWARRGRWSTDAVNGDGVRC